MKNFSKFADKQESPEEKLVEAERKVSVLLEKIKSYDQALDKFSVLNGRFESLEKKQLEIVSELDSIKSNTSNQQANCNNLKREISDSTIKNSQNFDSLDLKLQKFKEEFGSVFLQQLNDNEKSNQIIFNNLVDKIEENKKQILLSEEKLTDHSDFNAKRINEHFYYFKDKTESISKLQSANVKSIEWMQNKLQQSDKDCERKSLEQQSLIKSIQEKINSLPILIKDSLISEIERFKSDHLKSNEFLESFRSEVKKDIEISKLDSANSIAKSNNCNKQIEILERKIESINIVLKKLELSASK